MAKLKVETMVVIDRNPIGSTIELEERTAKRLEAQKYVRIIGKATEPKKESAPKKSPKAKPKKKTEE